MDGRLALAGPSVASMCRLLGFTSGTPQALDNVVGGCLRSFTDLSAEHGHGWGVASCDGDVVMDKEPEAAGSSELYADAVSRPTSGALVHLRKASSGLTHTMENTHPFTADGIAFIHNGQIDPYDAVDTLVAGSELDLRLGETDSEGMFLAILSAAQRMLLVDAVRFVLREVSQRFTYTSLNCMVLTPEVLIAAACYRTEALDSTHPRDYYDLYWSADRQRVVVGSSGWAGCDDWNVLPNRHMLVVERHTLSHQVLALD